MKKYTVLSVMALTCLSMQAAELDGVRYAGYASKSVPGGYAILAVPFSGFDTAAFVSTNLSLDSLISTNGLAVGDRLLAFDESTKNYYYYELTGSGWDPLDVTDVLPDSTNRVVNAPPLSTITKAQGYAFWLKTQSATTAYLQGIVNTNAAGVSVSAATSFTLVGNAMPAALDLNNADFKAANTWFTAGPPGVGDEIHVVNGTGYTKNVFFSGNWKLVEQTPSNTVFTADSATIPAGSGVWYLRRAGASATLVLK